MFSIGEFSKATGLTVKTLRFYHEQQILVPTHVDAGTGYRYYGEEKVETARVIQALRDLGFSINEIAEIVGEKEDDAGILDHLERRDAELRDQINQDRSVRRRIRQIIQHEREAAERMSESNPNVEEKRIEPILIAGVRMKGAYSDCGNGFSKIGKKFGRHICGKPMLLCFDTEYKAVDADFEACMPVRKGESTDEIDVRELPGGRCLSLMHHGPYDELRRSYEIMLKYISDHDIEAECPSREIYHKGPGMIFRGNPKKYLTEIQFLF